MRSSNEFNPAGMLRPAPTCGPGMKLANKGAERVPTAARTQTRSTERQRYLRASGTDCESGDRDRLDDAERARQGWCRAR